MREHRDRARTCQRVATPNDGDATYVYDLEHDEAVRRTVASARAEHAPGLAAAMQAAEAGHVRGRRAGGRSPPPAL
jgi:hypothetical protein